MRSRTALLAAASLAGTVACSLTTSLDGFANGDRSSAPTDAGDERAAVADASDAADTGSNEAGASDYRAAVLADNPLAYYRLGDTGTVAKDETGAHDGTYVGSVTHVAGAIAQDPSTAAMFDGTSYVNAGDIASFVANAHFTLEAWASVVPGASDPMCLVAKTVAPGGASGSVSDGYTVYADATTNKLSFTRFKNSDSSGPDGPALMNGRFTHVVATYDGTTMVIYVDGVRVADGASSASLVDPGRPLTIGAGRGGVYCYFRGALDEVAIYGEALSAARVTAHYDAAKKP